MTARIRPTSLLFLLLLVACRGTPDARLLRAAKKGDVPALRSALDAGAHLTARDEQSGATALCFAACVGPAEAVRILAKAGANVNAHGQCGTTEEWGSLISDDPVIFYAAERGRTESIKALIEMGADVNAKGLWGRPSS